MDGLEVGWRQMKVTGYVRVMFVLGCLGLQCITWGFGE